MLNILTKIADRYTVEPDLAPEVSFARFVAGVAKAYGQAARELAVHDPAIR